MIVKIEFGKSQCIDDIVKDENDKSWQKKHSLHMRIVECKDIHIEAMQEPEPNGLSYFEIAIQPKEKGEDNPSIQVGKFSHDIVYLMEDGKTVDKMHFPFFYENKKRMGQFSNWKEISEALEKEKVE